MLSSELLPIYGFVWQRRDIPPPPNPPAKRKITECLFSESQLSIGSRYRLGYIHTRKHVNFIFQGVSGFYYKYYKYVYFRDT